MKWFFDGIGSQIVGFLLTLIFGRKAGNDIRNKIMNSQKANNNSIQSQNGNINVSNSNGEANEIGDNSQKQVAGKNSTQIQTRNLIVKQGISEKRVRQIIRKQVKQLTVYTQEAVATASERINKLENAFMQLAHKTDGAFEAFSDPAFRLLLRDTAEKAAATEREDDYDLLSELLICHIEKGDERIKRAGIHHAIAIVDEIDNDALCALTIVYAVLNVKPTSGSCSEGLKIIDGVFSNLQYMELPSDTLWLDHLDILRAIRIDSIGKLMPLSEIFSNELDGYVCVGIKKDSPQFEKAVSILSNYEIFEKILVENVFLEGYVRLDLSQKRNIDKMKIFTPNIEDNTVSVSSITNEMKDALYKVYDLYSNDPNLMIQVKQKFLRMLDKYEHISKIKQWWESIPLAFEITSVGKVLAHTNAKRCDSNIPNWEL